MLKRVSFRGPGLLAVLAALFFFCSVCRAQAISQGGSRKRLTAIRLNSEIRVDGLLNEPFWSQIPPAQGFVQSEPNEGQPASSDSEVRIAFDDQNLYLGVICHEPDPQRVIVTDLRRDFVSRDGDSFEIVLDTFNDDRNGFLFVTSPAGAKLDAQLANDGRNIDEDWDGVWQVRSQINSNNWSAEIVIPFKTLRFSKGSTGTWGINFIRRIRHKNEVNAWLLLPRRYMTFERSVYLVSLSGDLVGLEGMRQSKNLKVKPFALTTIQELAGESLEGDFDAGVDVKYGLTSGMTLDGTVNTDFSQVEADEQQINLTRFPLFFPEKRDFFLENSGIFQFGDIPGERGPNRSEETQLFFSRRIGLSDDNTLVPILGGVRVSGRAGPYSLGMLNIQTKGEGDVPAENFTGFRFRRDIFSSSDFGAIFLNRQADASNQYNRSFGADANLRFFENLTFYSYLAQTLSPGVTEDDWVWKASGEWRDNFTRIQLVYADIGENFNPEMGFNPRAGVRRTRFRFELHPRPPANRFIREFHPHVITRYFTDPENRTLTKRGHVGFQIVFQDGANVEVKVENQFERLDEPFDIRSDISIPVGDYRWNQFGLEYQSDPSQPLSATLNLIKGDFFGGHRTSLTAGTIFRPHYKLSFDFRYTGNDVTLSQDSFSTNLFLLRMNYAFNPRMFLNGLIQYNSDTGKISSNIRFNLIHRPLSDLFIVFNDQREVTGQRLADRGLVIKYTHLIDF